MLRATTADGLSFRGSTPTRLVRAMKRRSWQHDARKGEYMHGVVDRVEQMTATRFAGTITVDSFLEYLKQVGFLEITEVPDK